MDGCADTIMEVLRKLCSEHCCVGSDSAARMMGNQNGVAAQLKQAVQWIIANHCVAHRLALTTAQAADEILYFKICKSILGLYRFYKYSAVCTAGLKEIEPTTLELDEH